MRLAAALVFVVLLGGGAAAIGRAREARYPPPAPAADALYVTSPSVLARLTIGYNALAADLYWIRAIQYYGGQKLALEQRRAQGEDEGPREGDFALLYPLLDLTTTLDPRFNIAYRFGAIFLAEAHPGGAGRPDQAIALLEKGLQARPDKWEYMQDIGFVHYWWRHDYEAAARWFDRASQVPGAPWFLRSLAATTLTEGGDRESSRIMWQSIHETAEIDWLRTESERRLMQLDALDFVSDVQGKVDSWRQQTGRVPESWDALIGSRVIPGLPVDPTGTPYVLADGQVQVARSSRLFPLPVEPKRIQ